MSSYTTSSRQPTAMNPHSTCSSASAAVSLLLITFFYAKEPMVGSAATIRRQISSKHYLCGCVYILRIAFHPLTSCYSRQFAVPLYETFSVAK